MIFEQTSQFHIYLQWVNTFSIGPIEGPLCDCEIFANLSLKLYKIFFMFLTVLIAGNVAQILAIVAIFYAVDLPKAQLPRPETDWLLVAFVAFHFLTHLVLSAINCNADNGKM